MNGMCGVALLASCVAVARVPAMADEPLVLNCQCTSVFNSSFPDRDPTCSLYGVADVMVIVDTPSHTVDLKSSNASPLVQGLSGPATILPGTIKAHWTGSPTVSAVRNADLVIDRTSGTYTLGWDLGETKIRWSGLCKKSDMLPTQF